MGCRGCPGGGRAKRKTTPVAASAPVPAASASTPGDDNEFVKIKYMVQLQGMHGVTGTFAINPLNGARFYYGQHAGGHVFNVHRDDVWRIDQRTGQRVLRDARFLPIEEQTVKLPPAEPVPTPPPDPLVEIFDPQTLPGIRSKPAAEMLARGLDSKEKVLEAGIEGLMAVPGIGEITARKVLEYLNRE